MPDIERMRSAIREEGLSGWLFYNMAHRDAIADLILRGAGGPQQYAALGVGLLPRSAAPEDRPPDRGGDSAPPAGGNHPVLHAGGVHPGAHAGSPRAGRFAADFSRAFPWPRFSITAPPPSSSHSASRLASAEGLVAGYLGTVDETGRLSQESSGEGAARRGGGRMGAGSRRRCAAGRTVREGDLQDWIAGSIAAAGLQCDPPIAGAGRHTNDPHFAVEGRGAVVQAGDVVQFDIWARGRRAGGGLRGHLLGGGLRRLRRRRSAAGLRCGGRGARGGARLLLERSSRAGTPVRGADVDRAAARRARRARLRGGHPPPHGAFHRQPRARLRGEPRLRGVPRRASPHRGAMLFDRAGDLPGGVRHAHRDRLLHTPRQARRHGRGAAGSAAGAGVSACTTPGRRCGSSAAIRAFSVLGHKEPDGDCVASQLGMAALAAGPGERRRACIPRGPSTGPRSRPSRADFRPPSSARPRAWPRRDHRGLLHPRPHRAPRAGNRRAALPGDRPSLLGGDFGTPASWSPRPLPRRCSCTSSSRTWAWTPTRRRRGCCSSACARTRVSSVTSATSGAERSAPSRAWWSAAPPPRKST